MTMLFPRLGQKHAFRSRPAFRPSVGEAGSSVPLEPRQLLAQLPTGFVESRIASGFFGPTAMAVAPDGRIFVAEQGGAVRIVRDGAILPIPFIQVPTTIYGERGLTGLALDPRFEDNGHVYLYATAVDAPMRNQVVRYTASGDQADPASRVVLLDLPPIDPRRQPYHNGGGLHFGPDGKLYVGVGDHEDKRKAQDRNSPFGKILRINPDGTFPDDNPFARTGRGLGKAVYALGLRNPFTFAFQAGSGRLLVNDVGQTAWEEINDILPGRNYGWPSAEGPSPGARFAPPLHAYRHGRGSGQGCAVVGGTFVPTSGSFPDDMRGDYLFGEFCKAELRRLDLETGQVSVFASGLPAEPTDLDFAPDGALYVLARRDPASGLGVIDRIAPATSEPPRVTDDPDDLLVTVGQPARFRASVAGAGPLAYQWFRNGQPIPGQTAPDLLLPTTSLDDDGALFSVAVSSPYGQTESRPARLAVSTNQPPQAEISSPPAGTRWGLGSTIRFRGRAVDPEAGELPPSALSWTVQLVHDDHLHPVLGPLQGVSSGSFRIPPQPHGPGHFSYRINLTATDPNGLTSRVTLDLLPRTGMRKR